MSKYLLLLLTYKCFVLLLFAREHNTFLVVCTPHNRMTKHLLRRFRKEIREREDIQPNCLVQLQEDPRREANIQAAKLLLHDTFKDQIRIEVTPQASIICGSREEAAINRLKEYTREEVNPPDLLLTTLTQEEIHEYLRSKGVDKNVFVPASPEQRFVKKLGEDFPDVLYGL